MSRPLAASGTAARADAGVAITAGAVTPALTGEARAQAAAPRAWPTATATAIATRRAPLDIQRLELAEGEHTRQPLVVPADTSVLWVVWGTNGQQLTVRLHAEEGAAKLRISGADASLLLSEAAGTEAWRGVLPARQDYFIEVIADAEKRFVGTIEISLEKGNNP